MGKSRSENLTIQAGPKEIVSPAGRGKNLLVYPNEPGIGLRLNYVNALRELN